MSLFNSLGSNYDWQFVWQYLIASSPKKAPEQLRELLGEHFGGAVTLTYKGRQALELALEQAKLPKGSRVGINGFTCFVLWQAVERAGYAPVFVDVANNELNFGVSELDKVNSQDAPIEAVIIQNTLGLSPDTNELEIYCQKNGIIIIEDLAHSLGMKYKDGRAAGTVGPLVMLSFSQDKPLDVVAGGALVDRQKNAAPITGLKQMGLRQRFINRTYPFWSTSIRALYDSGLGRYLHKVLKMLHLMATPMSDNLNGRYVMTTKAASQLLKRWEVRQAEFDHHRQIAKLYAEALPKSIQYKSHGNGALYLRFPIKIKNRVGFIQELKKSRIYIGDTWYDAPIGPKRYLAQTDYQAGLCPQAEKVAAEIVNLPTHININEEQAMYIAKKVNQWLESK